MTINELTEILSLMNLEKICSAIEEKGFRKAGESGIWEFNLSTLKKESADKIQVSEMDEATEQIFELTFFENCRAYEGFTFIEVFLMKRVKTKKIKIPIPRKRILFTDAPYNEEYERDINSIVKCDLCRREYIKKELVEYYGKRYCGFCCSFVLGMEYEKDRRAKKRTKK